MCIISEVRTPYAVFMQSVKGSINNMTNIIICECQKYKFNLESQNLKLKKHENRT